MNNKPIWTCSACGKTIDDPPATSQMPHCECGAYSWYSFPSNDGIRDTIHQRLKQLEDERDSWGSQFYTGLADVLGMDRGSSLDSLMQVVKDMKHHLERLVHAENIASGTDVWDVYEALRDANKFLNELLTRGIQC